MTKEVYDLGVSKYEHMVGLDTMERDSNGYLRLAPSAAKVDKRKSELTTNISDLEAKLKRFKEEKAQVEKIQKSDAYKESKKKSSKKKNKRQKANLLEMVFNNADHQSDEDDTDTEDDEDADGTYRDGKKKKSRNRKAETTLDSTYGKRFSPVVSMLHDTIVEFDQIADDISKELANARNQGKTMYRSSQIGNLISAKNSKLSAVKELASVVKTLSDLEYKKDKDKQAAEGGDTNKAISALGAKYLRTADIFGSGGGKGKKNKKGKKGSGGKLSESTRDDDDEDDELDDDDDIGTIKKQRERDQRELAAEFAKTLQTKKGDIQLTPHERFIAMEGKYEIWVVLNPMDESDWKFVAVDPKTKKEIKGFRDSYPGLLPKRKACRMVFDLGRLRAQDKNSSRYYKLVIKE